MVGNLLIVHEQDTTPPILGLVKLDQYVGKFREMTASALPDKRVEPFRRVLNVYVPCYPELRTIEEKKLESIVTVPFPRRQVFEEIFYGFVERVGELFPGWTELGRVATPWQPTKYSGEPMEFRWIYDHLLIAVNDESWRDKLLVAEAECEEAFLAVVTYYSDVTPLPAGSLEPSSRMDAGS
jgi:hypothetical protein